MAPPPPSRISGTAACVTRKGPVRLTAGPVLIGDLEDRLEDGDAGIVDQRIEAAKLGGDDVHGAGDAGGVGDVAGDGDGGVRPGERLDRAREIVAVDVEQRHPPAVGQKALGGGQSDAARGAGHEGGFVRLAHAISPAESDTGA